MKKVLLEISEELLAAVDAARGTESRNPAIERWLWNIGQIKAAAKKLGMKKPIRTKRGRPKHHASDETEPVV